MEAIYQRARPATFGEVVGQEHVKEVLAAALRNERIGHAYLFSGPRGVGKTTTARLLAMALNCDAEDPSARPCGRCESCTSIRGARHPDVTELDAASNNSVDDVRELRERVRLASLRGGTRVWILDEAHMLSTAAANALLKTLEEPPPGLVFVLATTEPERLPPTVLSRCQHFRFRRLSVPEIAGKLAGLCEAAGVEAEPEALDLVARAAEGAMRDAESLLERLLADGGPIRREAAEGALGLPPRERLEQLAVALAGDDLATLLANATALYRDGFSPRTVAEQLARVLRDAVVAEVTGDDGFRIELPRASLLRSLHQFDDELDRFVRHDDLYALEAALIKASNAAHARLAVAPAHDHATAGVAPSPSRDAGGVRSADARSADARPAEAPTATRTQVRGDAPADVAPGPRSRAGGAQRPAAFDPNAAPSATPPTAAPSARGRGERSDGADGPPYAPPDAPGGDGPAHDGSGRAGEGATAAAAAGGDAARTVKAQEQAADGSATLSWHQVKSRASAQLKAFLQPAEDEVADGVLTLRYGERHRFHFGQLKERQEELMTLVSDVGGPGWSVVIAGPDETIRKKA